MGILGYVHLAFGVLAIVTGLAIFCLAKGTALHRVVGYVYVVNMVGLNGTALLIYRVFRTFGPFHVLAILSLIMLIAGFLPAYLKRPAGTWVRNHYEGMCWSYVGLLAATAAEIAARLPFVRGFGLAFGIATFVASCVVVFLGALILYRHRDQVLAGLQPPVSGPNPALQPTRAASPSTAFSTPARDPDA